MTALYNEWRPRLFKHVFGQAAVVVALQAALKQRSTQSFLFSGPSGVGKTTLARILANKLQCQLTEIDGATYSGVDKMREIVSSVQYVPFGERGHAVIIDECHRISAQAWDSSLKAVEEPPPGVHWLFCTTNPGKVPDTIQTRALHLRLKPLARDTLSRLVEEVAQRASIALEPTIIQLVVAEAHGSARQALVNLDACRSAATRVQAAQLLHTLQEGDVGLQLCRTLAGYENRESAWTSAMQLLDKLLAAGEEPEGLRIRICHYFTAAIRKAEPQKAAALLQRMEPFAYAYGQADAAPHLVRSIGASLFSN
jgi:DNA polymerase III gamma/tau subunit